MFSRKCHSSRHRIQPTIIVTTPITAAGGPPRKTIASTSERKLPEIFTLEEVLEAVTSLTTENTRSATNSGRSQCVSATEATATAAASAKSSSATT